MKEISHPNILSIIDIIDSDDYIYMILELVSGGDLFDAVVTKGHYSEDEARQIFGQLASAVGYLHSHGIAHRDLKPENILLTKTGQVKLSDFGLSKIIGEEQLMKTLCGTPKYLAPEIIFHSEGTLAGGYSNKVDCWAMGVILFILMGGYTPFGDESFEQIKNGEFDFEETEWETVSESAKELICKLLTVNPHKRFSVADIFSHPWMKSVKQVEGPKTPIKGEENKEAKTGSPSTPKKSKETKSPKPDRSKKEEVEEEEEEEEAEEEDEEEEEDDTPTKSSKPKSKRGKTRGQTKKAQVDKKRKGDEEVASSSPSSTSKKNKKTKT